MHGGGFHFHHVAAALAVLASLALPAACSSADKDAYFRCRGDCTGPYSTCFNACNSSTTPGACRTDCARKQLVCQERYPG